MVPKSEMELRGVSLGRCRCCRRREYRCWCNGIGEEGRDAVGPFFFSVRLTRQGGRGGGGSGDEGKEKMACLSVSLSLSEWRSTGQSGKWWSVSVPSLCANSCTAVDPLGQWTNKDIQGGACAHLVHISGTNTSKLRFIGRRPSFLLPPS